MRRLIVMRHAKSSWAEPDQRDHDRPLNGRGRRDAPAMGAWLRQADAAPDAALVSTAQRTRETWALLGFADVPVTLRADLYHAEPAAILAALRDAPEVETLLVLGHQPGIGAAARLLPATPPESPDFAKYPTTATTIIAFDVGSWAQVGWGEGRVEAFRTPRSLG